MLVKKTYKTIITALLVLYIIFIPIFIFPAFILQADFINRQNTVDYYGVLELWNVDTFEGGSIGRANWLEARSIEFERANPGAFVIVRNMTEEQAILNLENGNKPSLISYGIGFGSIIANNLTNYTGLVQVRDDLLKGGMLNDTLLAVPFILGGYALIGNEYFMEKASTENDYNLLEDVFNFMTKENKQNIYSLTFGGNMGYNAPLALALNTSMVAGENAIDEQALTLNSYDAYVNYVENNASVLLGTQRDVYRCKNRESNNNMEPNVYEFLGGFSDLVQYISIFETDNQTKYMCERFIEYLTSEEVQKTLSRINMFSVLDLKIYSDVFYREWEKVLAEPLKTFNVFLHKENIKDKINTSLNALKGSDEARKKINDWF
ncbi:MAG: hypothetical protein PHC46_02145 [Clostridia bacterium]|nr:hypothetical protein [Clostridia bacterium]